MTQLGDTSSEGPWARLVASGSVTQEYIPDGWNWRAQLPMLVWYSLAHWRFPDWDQINGQPPYVMIEHDEPARARTLSCKLDDWARGLFYHRDWTRSGLPFVAGDEPYWSGWWFQHLSDALEFRTRYGGIGSWEPDFEQELAQMNAKRNGEAP